MESKRYQNKPKGNQNTLKHRCRKRSKNGGEKDVNRIGNPPNHFGTHSGQKSTYKKCTRTFIQTMIAKKQQIEPKGFQNGAEFNAKSHQHQCQTGSEQDHENHQKASLSDV